MPDWLSVLGSLDDTALAALANKGLVRRALKLEVTPVSISDSEANVRCAGTPDFVVKLLPAGPQAAICPCPAAGICVHVVAACVWARTGEQSISDDSAALPASAHLAPSETVPSGPASSELAPSETALSEPAPTQPTSAAPGATQPSAAHPAAPVPSAAHPAAPVPSAAQPIAAHPDQQESVPDGTTSETSVLNEALSWDSAKVNRSAGIAAVRKLAVIPVNELTLVNAHSSAATLTLEWDGSPNVIVVRGGGFDAMIVSGKRSVAESKRIKLEAIVRLWRFHGKEWPWPAAIADSDGVLEAELLSAKQGIAVIEQLVFDGLGHVSQAEADRLRAASQNAKIEDLPLLSAQLLNAEAVVRKLAVRDDSTSEEQALSALAQAWALASAIAGTVGPLPTRLRGTRDGEDANTGTLFPLGVEWWNSDSGARGFTAHWWDLTHKRLETLTTGRAAGTDPTFSASWDAPIAWNRSLSAVFSGPFELQGAQRRPDGMLSPSSKTTVVNLRPGLNAGKSDLEELARAVNAAESDLSALGFGGTIPQVNVLIPQGKIDRFALDEVHQEIVWEVTDAAKKLHALRLPAKGSETNALNWIIASREAIRAIVVSDGDHPISVFAGTPARVYSLSLMSIPWTPPKNHIRKRQEKLRQVSTSHDLSARLTHDPILRWSAAAREPLASVAATGRQEFSPRQLSELTRAQRDASDLGLHAVAHALGPLLTQQWSTAHLLTAEFMVGRVESLSAALPG